MNPSAPATIRIRFSPWGIAIFCGAAIIIGSTVTFMRGPELSDLFFFAGWLIVATLLATGALCYMRVSAESVAVFRNQRRREVFPLRPGDQFVVTYEGAYIWRREGRYENLGAKPIWTGQRQWDRLQAWAAQHWTQPVDPRTRWPSPEDASRAQRTPTPDPR
jgi:hypothetical protein